jgi:hypothetical protein
MDPNKALRQLRNAVDYYRRGYGGKLGAENREELLAGLVDEFEALDGWLTRGGFLPEAWRRGEQILAKYGPVVTVEPLGPPDPAHVEMPEGSEMESQYPRDFEDGEGIRVPSYGE